MTQSVKKVLPLSRKVRTPCPLGDRESSRLLAAQSSQLASVLLRGHVNQPLVDHFHICEGTLSTERCIQVIERAAICRLFQGHGCSLQQDDVRSCPSVKKYGSVVIECGA